MSTEECKDACNKFGMKGEKLKNGHPCYIFNKNKCRQDGQHGTGASMLCMKTGKIIYICRNT